MNRRTAPSLAAPLSLAQALDASEPLGRLTERLRRSKGLFAVVAPLVPAGLAPHVQAGPLDEEGWSLLCANASVAAKLRQLVPRLERQLQERGLVVSSIRIKVLPR